MLKGLADHIHRNTELVANPLLLWAPKHDVSCRGRPAITFVDSIQADTELNDTEEIGRHIVDGVLLRQRIDYRTQESPESE